MTYQPQLAALSGVITCERCGQVQNKASIYPYARFIFAGLCDSCIDESVRGPQERQRASASAAIMIIFFLIVLTVCLTS